MKINVEKISSTDYKFSYFLNNERIGYLLVKKYSDNIIVSFDTFVKKEHRRQKVATNLYDYAENFFSLKLIPNEYYNTDYESSEDAVEFWRSRGKFLINYSKIYD